MCQDARDMARLLGEAEEERDALLQEVHVLREQAGMVGTPQLPFSP